MANAWDGADPVQVDDGPTVSYELGVAVTVVEDVTITGVRVWHGANSATVVGRSARLWTTGGSELDVIDLDDALAAGWTTYELEAPLERTAGQQFVLSYSTRQYYGATAGGFPNDSADAAITLTGGVFRVDGPGLFPSTPSSSFFGIDLVYTLGIGGNVAPVVSVSATAAGRTVTAVATVQDEAPGTVAYRWEWGDGQVTADGAATEQHAYAADGIYAVLVTATDAGGLKDSAAAAVVARAGATGGMVLADVLGQIADRLDTVPGLNVYRGYPKKIVPPAAIVTYPEIDFDLTFARGADAGELFVVVLLARLTDQGELEGASAYASGFGSRSIKAVIESGEYTAMKYVRVSDAVPDVHTMAAVEYLAYVHSITVAG